MRIRSISLAVLVCAAFISSAVAATPRLAVSPNPVHRGHAVRVYGAIPGCVIGDQVTLISRAFSHRHAFAGVSAVFARVGSHHRYSVRTLIPAGRKPGRYTITGRCGGGNLGVAQTLRVLR